MTSRMPGPQASAGGPVESFSVERASATPHAPRPRRARRRPAAAAAAKPASGTATRTGAASPRTPMAPALPAMPLAELQRWFFEVIAHPGTVSDGVAAAAGAHALGAGGTARLLASAANLGPVDRMGIYHYAYHARLADCLVDDFPTVQHALGHERFRQLCAEVIRDCPSGTPNLNHYGAVLPRWCADRSRRLPHRAFIAELAALEWAMVEVFHADPAPTLSLEAVQAVPMAEWADMRFAPSPSLRLLRFRHPVNAYLQAYREGASPAIPRAKASATAVYRVDFRLWRMDLTPITADLLESLLGGEALGAALERLAAAPGVDPGQLGANVMRWFREWVAGGFFTPRLG
jgi:hypothetical protein